MAEVLRIQGDEFGGIGHEGAGAVVDGPFAGGRVLYVHLLAGVDDLRLEGEEAEVHAHLGLDHVRGLEVAGDLDGKLDSGSLGFDGQHDFHLEVEGVEGGRGGDGDLEQLHRAVEVGCRLTLRVWQPVAGASGGGGGRGRLLRWVPALGWEWEWALRGTGVGEGAKVGVLAAVGSGASPPSPQAAITKMARSPAASRAARRP